MSSEKETTTHADVIKLGVDVHANKYVVARQIDGASPQAPQRFTPEEFLLWAKKEPMFPARTKAAQMNIGKGFKIKNPWTNPIAPSRRCKLSDNLRHFSFFSGKEERTLRESQRAWENMNYSLNDVPLRPSREFSFGETTNLSGSGHMTDGRKSIRTK